PPCRDVVRQPFLQASSQMWRLLNQRVVQCTGEFGELFRRPIQHIARQQPASRTQFDHINSLRRIESAPHLLELPRQQPPENGMNIAGGVEVAGLAELLSRLRVIAKLRLVQTQFHVARKRNRPLAANLLRDALAQLHSLPSRSICWCSLRCCGVRMNISTRESCRQSKSWRWKAHSNCG